MYSASLTEKGDRVSIVIRDDDDPSKPVHIFPMTIENAKMWMLWLDGMSDLKAPVELEFDGVEHYLEYEVWFPMRGVLNKWYEDYHAPV